MNRSRLAALTFAVLALLATPAFAQTGTLFVEGSEVGIGIANPSRTFHIFGNSGSAAFRVEEAIGTTNGRVMMELINNGGVNFRMIDTSGATWQFLSENAGSYPGFSISLQGSGVREFRVAPNGDLFTSGAINPSSSKAIKHSFAELDADQLLTRLDALPIMTWVYKADDSGTRHIGPFAEDFHRLFSVGTDPQHISTIDASGVALAAAQELHRRGQEKDERIADLESQVQELRAMVEQLAAQADAAPVAH